ncbi:hypothetical protein Tco_0038898 [Tanacetum coccineum]
MPGGILYETKRGWLHRDNTDRRRALIMRGICTQWPEIEQSDLFCLAFFASYMGISGISAGVYKSAFLYGEIEEEVYVRLLTLKGFEDPYFSANHVYRVFKALYDFIKHSRPRRLVSALLLVVLWFSAGSFPSKLINGSSAGCTMVPCGSYPFPLFLFLPVDDWLFCLVELSLDSVFVPAVYNGSFTCCGMIFLLATSPLGFCMVESRSCLVEQCIFSLKSWCWSQSNSAFLLFDLFLLFIKTTVTARNDFIPAGS